MSSCLVDEATLGRTPLRFAMHDAAEVDDVSKLDDLLRQEKEHDAADADYAAPVVPGMEFTPLDKNERDNHGCTPLHVSALYASMNCFKLLIQSGAKVNLKCNGSPLVHMFIAMYAIPENVAFVTEAVSLLLNHPNLDLLATDDMGRTWAHVCATVGATNIATACYGKMQAFVVDAVMNAVDKQGRTAVHTAASYKQKEMLDWLLAQTTGPKALVEVDAVGNTPAHSAAKAGWGEGMEFLLSATATYSLPDLSSRKNWAGLTPREELEAVLSGPVENGKKKTLILTHPSYNQHRTCEPIDRRTAGVPPENTARLDTLLNSKNGTLRQADILSRAEIEYSAPQCAVSDVLRVHEYPYIRKLLTSIGTLTAEDEAEGAVTHLDGDTAVSKGSWDAALYAAGAVCAAIDRVVSGEVKNAFCPVRPPGHHAGPHGVVTCENDKDGSHGFCLLNNVLVGAAYARANYGRAKGSYGLASRSSSSSNSSSSGAGSSGADDDSNKPIRRIAIFDFDVHHGNGSEAIIRSLYPSELVETVNLQGFGTVGAFSTMVYRPWLDEEDGNDVMFVSSHGYGKRDPENPSPFVGWFYPGSGPAEGWNSLALQQLQQELGTGKVGEDGVAAGSSSSSSSSSAAGSGSGAMQVDGEEAVDVGAGSRKKRKESSGEDKAESEGEPESEDDESSGAYSDEDGHGGHGGDGASVSTDSSSASSESGRPAFNAHGVRSNLRFQPKAVPEPLLEKKVSHPHIINFACPHGQSIKQWRRLMTVEVLPRIAAFKPDLILVSAGFDAHHKDSINCGYLGLKEDDYEWITQQLMKIANTHSNGRIVSVLEGGYRIHGRIVSAFGRSVAAHVRALASGYSAKWDTEKEKAQLIAEMKAEKEEAEAAARAKNGGSGSAAAELLESGSAGGAGSGAAALLSPSATANSGTGRTVSATGTGADASVLSTKAGAAAAAGAGTLQVNTDATPGSGTAVGSSETPASASAASGAVSGRSKRRRETVNYAELDQKLKAEAAAAAAAAAGSSSSSSSAAPATEDGAPLEDGSARPSKVMKTEEGQAASDAARSKQA